MEIEAKAALKQIQIDKEFQRIYKMKIRNQERKEKNRKAAAALEMLKRAKRGEEIKVELQEGAQIRIITEKKVLKDQLAQIKHLKAEYSTTLVKDIDRDIKASLFHDDIVIKGWWPKRESTGKLKSSDPFDLEEAENQAH